MLTWARLEGLTIEPPEFDDQAPPAHDLATIEAAARIIAPASDPKIGW
jgi:hypothetical protein